MHYCFTTTTVYIPITIVVELNAELNTLFFLYCLNAPKGKLYPFLICVYFIQILGLMSMPGSELAVILFVYA